MTRNKKIFAAVMGAVIAVLALWFFLRFVVGGPEDNWICDKGKGQWVKHGNPTAPMPTEPCGEKPQAEKSVELYYYNYELDRDEFGNTACSRNGLVPVERKIPITQTPIQDTIKFLLLGKLTEEERAQGIDTEYPLKGLSLKGASLKDGVLTLEFDDSKNKTVGGSCRVGILWFQIEATAKQFPEVRQVRFLPEEIFQP